MALYNEMRPESFADVKGQDSLVKILKDNLATGHMPNAMLFIGTRGTGKTTIARIVAKRVNCETPREDGECCNACPTCRAIRSGNYSDVLELDAASHNGVDDVRRIIEDVQLCPVGKKKVVILDEVHMLSTSAFNALLKVLEEPPKDVLFILCTTELQKIPATILSRCRKFQFENISTDMIVAKLKAINALLSLEAEEGALRMVAKAAKGSMRDAESIYESFIDEGCVTEELVRRHLGYSNEELVFSFLNAVVTGEPSGAFEVIKAVLSTGASLVYLLEDIMRVLLDVIFLQGCGDISAVIGTSEYLEKVSDIAFSVPMSKLLSIANAINEVYGRRRDVNLEIALQGMVVSLVCEQSAISALENKLHHLKASGIVVTAPAETQIMPVESLPPVIFDDEEVVSTDYSLETGTTAEVSVVTGGDNDADAHRKDDGFVPLSDEDAALLASMGFSVAPAVIQNTADEGAGGSSEDTTGSDMSEDVEEDFFFDDFARQSTFDGFGGFGEF